MAVTRQQVAELYVATFNRAPDAAGLAYCVAELTGSEEAPANMTHSVMIEAMKNGAIGDDATLIANKTAVAQAFADAGLNDVALAASVLAGVTTDTATVSAAQGAIDAAGETSVLTESLATLDAANTAKADWLKSLDKINSDLNDATAAVTADDTSIDTYYTNTTTALADTVANGGTGLADFGKKSVTLQDAAIAETLADFEKAVADAESDSAASEALISTVNTKIEELVAKNDASVAAITAKNGKAAELDAVEADGDFDSTAQPANENDALTVNGVVVAKVDSNGQLVLEEVADGADAATVTAFNAAQALAADYIAAFNAADAAMDAFNAAEEALTTAVKAVVKADVKANTVFDVSSLITNNLDGTTKAVDGDVAVDYAQNANVAMTADDAKAEVQTFTITAGAVTSAGNITIEGVTVAVALNDTIDQVGAKIAAADYSAATQIDKVTYTASTDTVTVTYVAGVDEADTTTVDTDTTGVTFGAVATTQEGTDAVQKAATDADALNTAINDLEAFEKLVEQFEESRDLNTELTALTKAVTDAKAAITNDADDEEAPGLGLDLITIDDTNNDTAAADAESNVFIMSLEDDSTVSISNFGTDGLDQLFVGSEYNFVELGSTEKIADSLGDVSALEIFYEQDGSDVKLYIENETFAGNGSSATDMVTVTLTGVTLEDVTMANGFISAGEIA
jgi:S-layer protein